MTALKKVDRQAIHFIFQNYTTAKKLLF